MLLSFYENSVMDRTSHIPGREIKDVAPQSFAHHDGAMAVLGLRRRSGRRSDHSLDLDKLVRRQLVRSLLLRSMPVPLWLRDGAAFGEPEFALELDRCMVRAGELRHQASRLLMSPTSLSVFEKADETARLQNLLAEAQALDDSLERWTHSLPPEHRYSVHTVQGRNGVAADNRILDNIVHIYPTMGHAGMWNRYRALGISVKAIALQSFTLLDTSPTSPSTCLTQTVQSQIEQLASDFCASIPYVFGLVKATDHSDQTTNEPDNVVSSSVTTVPGSGLESLKATVKPSTAAWLLCWPLAMAMMVEQIPARQKQYLRDRLRDVSEIVEDGVLERIAGGAVG
ncbi:hypothetical protein H2203_002603 [Taxawa tesnikishii (nom. ined.)]|nr:hypothetical protein H2203_002603 [Dothideales sp. JES 119]